MGELVKRACIECGAEFTTVSGVRVTCSGRCRKRATKGERMPSLGARRYNCVICGGPFVPRAGMQTICLKDECRAKREAQRRKVQFSKNGTLEARKVERAEDRAYQLGRAQPRAIRSGLPCFGCAHWRPLEGATFGGQCIAERWNFCKPLKPGAAPLVPVEVQA